MSLADLKTFSHASTAMTRALLLIVIGFVTVAPSTVYADETLTIGSRAPNIDIEHWLQDGNGFFKPVKTFEQDKVYVIEFWATWCGPCIMSMPHLAELQNRFRGRGVQIISVTDESVDEVNALLNQQHPQANLSFGDISSAYSLTCDPDRSTHAAYMNAAKQSGIPTSFVVGKTGKIEWIGHPAELEAPLEAIVTDQWDRKKFHKTFQAKARYTAAMQKLTMLAGAGKFDRAIALVDTELAVAKQNDMLELVNQWVDIRFSLMLSAGRIDDATIAYYRSFIDDIKDNPIALGRFGYSLFSAHQEGGKLGPLAAEVIQAIDDAKVSSPAESLPFLHNTRAQLYLVDNKIAQAIDAQQDAIDSADERQKRRMIPFLDQLKAKLASETAIQTVEN